MDPEKFGTVFVAGLLVVGLLSSCNLGNSVTHQAGQLDASTLVPDGAATGVPAAVSNPTARPAKAQPTSTPTIKLTNAAKPTVGSAVTPKQPSVVTNNKQPTPTVAPKTTSKKQGDDLEQQVNQLLDDLDNTDTVNDAGK